MRTNWAGNYTYSAPTLARPDSIAQAQETIASAKNVHALGSRHSFNSVADCLGTQISLDRLPRQVDVDPVSRTATIDGGIRYGDLAPVLHEQGFALANLASLPHISVAGAVATATHGSGSEIGNLATAITGLDLISATGDIITLTRETDGFAGAVISLGALGVAARLTLQVEPTYDIAQTVYTGLSHDLLETEFDEIFSAGTSVSVFTDWQGDIVTSTWVKDRMPVRPAPDILGVAATEPVHPLPGGAAGDCTAQLSQPGPWFRRLPHFRMEFSPGHGAEIQAEYFVPRDQAGRAVAALRKQGKALADLLLISEVRTVAADDLWLSPGHNGPYAAFHFTFRRDTEAVRAILPLIETDLGALGAVPHWGKVTAMQPEQIRASYPRTEDFRALAQEFDPEGKFRNPYIDRMIFGV